MSLFSEERFYGVFHALAKRQAVQNWQYTELILKLVFNDIYVLYLKEYKPAA